MFLQPYAKNFHVQYLDVTRHWSPRSENFAGGDSLLTAIQRGWEIDNQVIKEDVWHGEARRVTVYHFHLRRGEHEITMPVVSNPYVTRMLWTAPFDVIEMNNGDDTRRAG